MQNYPNPFTGSSFIEYYLPESVFVSLKVYNLNGQEVETLVNKYQSSGVYQISFSSENKSSGIYFYVLNVGSFIETKRMILLE
jgi:hypothetical protein